MASFTAVAFVPSILLSVTVFPPSDEEGIFLPNMLAAFAYGLGLTMAVSFLLLLRISSLLDPLNKGLKATSYLVEDSRNKRSLPGDGGYYSEVRQKTKEEVQRDQLLGEYQTNPAMGRLRKYLVGAAALSVLGWVLGSISGGEMSLNEEWRDERRELAQDEEVMALWLLGVSVVFPVMVVMQWISRELSVIFTVITIIYTPCTGNLKKSRYPDFVPLNQGCLSKPWFCTLVIPTMKRTR
ncbi:Uncharacterized protein SCF082_LOCUS42537 [Durusdinium trenchii]|uniref:Uncharacterized protein n=1 Tax=Durusdinium trenchii TaxID=1381693 RepID=A0ABP0QPH5_9DINO